MDVIYYPLFVITFGIIFLALAISFFNDKGTWLMIYYGCAPDSKLEKMNKQLINNICAAFYLFISLLFFSQLYGFHIGHKDLVDLVYIVIVVAFVALHIITFYLCQIKTK
ncbi:MAG: hypothetical protein IJ593_08525 [Lachnospiraceae bacterium]|nr:hypothetical protein [Lachnospiraceae bacterium]